MERPHKSSYFLPGKTAGLTMLYLIDTGCNTNLISKRIFDQLPRHLQDQRMVCDTHGQMADSTRLLFYGVVKISIKIKGVKLEEIFVISQISEDIIFGMLFLTNHDCRMEFTKPVVILGGGELVCTDWYGRLMASRVQMIKKVTIPPKTEIALSCRLTLHNCAPERLIESSSDKVVLANSINRPGEKGAVLVRRMNPTSQALKLPAGTTIGMLTSIDQTDVSEGESQHDEAARLPVRPRRFLSTWRLCFSKPARGALQRNRKVNWLTCSLATRQFSVRMARTSVGPSLYTTVYQLRKKPDPSGSPLTHLDHVKSRRQNARCKILRLGVYM